MKTIAKLCVAACIALGVGSTSSVAQTSGLQSQLSVAVTMSPHAESVSAVSISPLLGVKYAFENNWFIGGHVGVSYVSVDRKSYGTESSFNVGNPILMAGYNTLISSSTLSADVALL